MKKFLLFAAMALFTISAAAQNIGRVSMEELVTLMPEYMEAQTTLAAVSHETSETYDAMVTEYQNKVSQYQQKQSTWTAAIKEAKEKELMDLQSRIQQFQQTAGAELQEKQGELIAPVQQKAFEAVRELAKANGITVVFDVSSLVYYDEDATIDLMPEARKALGIPEGRDLEQVRAEINALQQLYAE